MPSFTPRAYQDHKKILKRSKEYPGYSENFKKLIQTSPYTALHNALVVKEHAGVRLLKLRFSCAHKGKSSAYRTYYCLSKDIPCFGSTYPHQGSLAAADLTPAGYVLVLKEIKECFETQSGIKCLDCEGNLIS